MLALETRLAEKQMTPVELRDPEPQYNRMTPAQLTALAPDVDWGLYLRSIGAADVKEVIVCQPEFLKCVGKLWRQIPPADWRTYLRWHLATRAAPHPPSTPVTTRRPTTSLFQPVFSSRRSSMPWPTMR